VSVPPILLYDGSCGFCQASVQWVLRRDRHRTLRFAPLQGVAGTAILARHPALDGADSVVWVDDPGGALERVAIKSGAARRILGYLGGRWGLLRVCWVVPRVIRDGIYDLIARHRHRIPIGADACLLPGPEERARFLD
jgi:predicted DCC family thiol-disulfide oxidoreductase YuxK